MVILIKFYTLGGFRRDDQGGRNSTDAPEGGPNSGNFHHRGNGGNYRNNRGSYNNYNNEYRRPDNRVSSLQDIMSLMVPTR